MRAVRLWMPLSLILVSLLPAPVVRAQAPGDGPTLSDLDDAGLRLAGELAAILPKVHPDPTAKPRVSIGAFPLNGAPSDLGALWSGNLEAFLSQRHGQTLSVVLADAQPAADLRVQGRILLLAETVRIYTQLVRNTDSVILWADHSDFRASAFVRRLIPSRLEARPDGPDYLDPYEPNDTPWQASWIPVGVEIETAFIRKHDVDWFRFDIEGEKAFVEISTQGDLDTLMELYDHENNLLDEDDDSGLDLNALIRRELSPGTYLIKVTEFRGEPGAYTLRVSEVPRSSVDPDQGGLRQPDILFVPTPQGAVDKMLELAEIKPGDVIYDLGCGDGRIVITAAKRYGVRAIGIDIDPLRVSESRENVRKNGLEHLVRIEHADIFEYDFSDADVVTLYLLPSLNVKLMPQLSNLKPGTRIVSYQFDMQGAKPARVVTGRFGETRHQTIYKWVVPWEPDGAERSTEPDRAPEESALGGR